MTMTRLQCGCGIGGTGVPPVSGYRLDPCSTNSHHSGFTIIELLVVVGIIIGLLSLVIVAVNSATKASQKARSQALLASISKSLVQFKSEIGYLPPVLDVNRDLDIPPAPTPVVTYQTDIQNWFSVTSLAEYLIGYDTGENDGYGYASEGENPPLGIRHPSSDGVWDGTFNPAPAPPDGSLASRNPPLRGKVYGPYIQLTDEGLMGSMDGTLDAFGSPNVYFPGDALYNRDDPHAIVDYWGKPIRYYRRAYPPGAIDQSYRASSTNAVPKLSDVFQLRPYQIESGSETIGIADSGGSTATTFALESGEFAVFSSGPDKRAVLNVSIDPDGFNSDNITEVGP